jgi:hypothetical protein
MVRLYADQPPPKRYSPVLAVIAYQVEGDSQQPGLDPALSPEAGAFLVGSQETLLRQVVGDVWISNQQVDNAVHPTLMLSHDIFKTRLRYGFCSCLHSRVQACGQRGLHSVLLLLSLWTSFQV